MIEILLAIFLILLNGFFVAAEFALVRVRSTQLEGEASMRAKTALGIVKNLDPYLTAVQLGITFASLGLGWIGEPAVSHNLLLLFDWLNLSIDPEMLHWISFIIAFSLISFLHIVVGEVAPKSLAIARPLRTSLFVAWPMRGVFIVLYPAIKFLTAASNGILRIFKVEPVEGHSMAVSPEELRNIAQHSTTDGMIPEAQGDLLEKVFTFSDRVAREIMIPRGKVAAINLAHDTEDSLRFALEKGHTRYPLYRDNLDDILGVIHLKDLLSVLVGGDSINSLEEHVREAMYVPETTTAQQLLQLFKQERSHMALVVDEHGGVSGLITLEDTIEELVGEIQDEFDAERAPIEEVSGGLSLDGGYLLDDLVDYLGMEALESEVDTVSGYIMDELGRIAEVGDVVELGGAVIRVLTMDKMRIERVYVELPKPLVVDPNNV